MLTWPEKILFTLAVLATAWVAYRETQRLIRIITSGRGKPDWSVARRRLLTAALEWITLRRVFRFRLGVSLLHAFVAWAFGVYLLVNLGDVLEAYIPGFTFLGHGLIGNLYRLVADILSVLALIGMASLLIRRFVLKSPVLQIREDVLVHPKARQGIPRDSLIVGLFILGHVGARFLGESFQIAKEGPDPWQPLASTVARLWVGWSPTALTVAEHIAFWLALGLILLFIPYFPRSKHIHLIFAFFNFLLKPEKQTLVELEPLDFEDESIEQFGASTFRDLKWTQLMDPFACIMCMRCQEVCPAYNTGKVLSPAAIEVNKRYNLNEVNGGDEPLDRPLLGTVLDEHALWSCTACGACVEICPLGNEPMLDIMDIRRAQVLMEDNYPRQWQNAYRGMESAANPWGVPASERMKWAEGLNVPTVDDNPDFDVLWWVGCAPSTDARAQKTARALVKILEAAGVNYAVLGEREMCTGDSARRSGNEYLFYELANANVETLNEVKAKKIITTCPHCLHTLKNEYPAFGGHYEVIHHTQFIEDLIQQGRLQVKPEALGQVTYHDPCYLGRFNHEYEAPRFVVAQVGGDLVEMARSGAKSFCCGAGGAQIWKEEEGTARINLTRFQEAQATGADTLAVACPFCMIMLNDAAKELKSDMAVKDVAELVAENLKS
ncbi:MAG: (Fe-S)-binding protein [Chloroflexi bacterium]|nr:(Fe-S)-binding protein [Chloroflexota bacterium]